MKGDFFSDEQNLAELVSHMPEDDQRKFNNYGHFRVEPVFVDRVFVIYKATGLTASKIHKPPQVLSVLRVTGVTIDSRSGVGVILEDDTYKSTLALSHVPKKVFNYDIYMSVPARLQLRWDGRTVNNRVWRSLSFALLIKTKNRSNFYSQGNTYIETPNKLRQLYPDVASNFTF